MTSPRNVEDEAWVTLATNDTYGLGALTLGRSLHRVGTTRKLVVLVTPGVTALMRERLSGVFDLVQEVNVFDSGDAANLQLLARPDLGVTFTKLHCWKLTQFKKAVFLDADVLVLQNSDELFSREELSAAPDVGWPDCFNSGVFVFQPSNETYDALVHTALTVGSFDGGDQGLLNVFFNSWATSDISKHLPFIYNMTSSSAYTYLPAYQLFGKNVKIVHFIGPIKPWNHTYNVSTGQVESVPGAYHAQEHLQNWWSIFLADVQPSLHPDLAGLAGQLSLLTLGQDLSSDQKSLNDRARQFAWEQGQVDYLGADAFSNIQKKLDETLTVTSTQPILQEVAEAVSSVSLSEVTAATSDSPVQVLESASTQASESPAAVAESPAPAPELPVPAPELPAPAPEVSTPTPEVSAPAPELPAPAPEVPVAESPAPVSETTASASTPEVPATVPVEALTETSSDTANVSTLAEGLVTAALSPVLGSAVSPAPEDDSTIPLPVTPDTHFTTELKFVPVGGEQVPEVLQAPSGEVSSQPPVTTANIESSPVAASPVPSASEAKTEVSEPVAQAQSVAPQLETALAPLAAADAEIKTPVTPPATETKTELPTPPATEAKPALPTPPATEAKTASPLATKTAPPPPPEAKSSSATVEPSKKASTKGKVSSPTSSQPTTPASPTTTSPPQAPPKAKPKGTKKPKSP
ncbi:hypothetical protein CHUAL_010222 [Chamberlinius hualienensis]